jgi:hypothetical protein
MDDCCDTCRSAQEPIETLVPERRALIERAFRLEWLTIAWMIVEGSRSDEAQLRLAENPPDLVILDWMLPGVFRLTQFRDLSELEGGVYWPQLRPYFIKPYFRLLTYRLTDRGLTSKKQGQVLRALAVEENESDDA